MFLNKSLSALMPYVPGEQPKNTEKLIKLNTNESPFPPSPRIIGAVTGASLDELRLYPDPACSELICALADYHGVSPDMIFPGNGSDEILALIFHGMCENGAVFPDITYGFYKVFAEMFHVQYQVIPLRENFAIDIYSYPDNKQTIFIANPNAPTGLFLPLSEIEKLLTQNPDRLVVVDEAYIDFGGESAISLLPERENLIVTRTFSKSRALAGMRIGYAVSAPQNIAALNTLKYSFNPYNLSRLSISIGALSVADDEYFEETRKIIIQNREYLSAELRELGFIIPRSAANFILAGDNPKISGRAYYEGLRKNGVLVRYFPAPRIDNYVRITIGTREQIDTLLCVTRELLKCEVCQSPSIY